ncbi:class I SAM-dependent methyltransferase [Actinospica sp.]|uniref:class I SAM-dependent methyltransferase n=1 Tax=Actinospica sp. TaxID=1872142 RepID=UPI002C6F090E|nr:class I SAM-dependent methyltransferase [Actinospica sp.]HWG22652.1 class I SAM-dependent methyltransferase [Actinospica sp.]
MARTRPVGTVTRGTTAPNRLRRVDRWLLGTQHRLLWAAPADALAVDLGYGAYPVTTVEWAERLWTVRPDLRVLGLEIDPERVAAAGPYQRAPKLEFRLGGFELPVPKPPVLLRAFNVLRQYDEGAVAEVWTRLCAGLAPEGLLLEGTCSENGRIAVWATLDTRGPRTLSFAARLAALESPAIFAQRLPKALIHRNVPGENVHALLLDWDRAWAACAPHGAFGARQRWIAAARMLTTDWPVLDRESRWRLGELTVDWDALAPRG